MKQDTHPDYQEVLFIDTATGHKFVCGSTLKPEETEEFEGKTYPAYKVPISSASHPFFTGSQQFIDSEGRVDKFMKRYAKTSKKSTSKEESKEPAKKSTSKKKK